MTELRSQQYLTDKPGSYYGKILAKTPLEAEEMKAFVGLRLIMEYFVIKRSYSAYWSSSRVNFASKTPGVPNFRARSVPGNLELPLHCR